MKKLSASILALVFFIGFSQILSSCSHKEFYVFKTVKNTPVEKNLSKNSTDQNSELISTTKEEAVTETAAAEEAVYKRPAANLSASTEAVPVIVAENEAPVYPETQTVETKKLSKLEQIKAAVALKKELKKVNKELLKDSPAQETGGGKSQLVALLLGIFVGVVGIHRFYLGYTAIGIVQILTLGGCGIWALIDVIRIAIGDLQPKDGPYEETL